MSQFCYLKLLIKNSRYQLYDSIELLIGCIHEDHDYFSLKVHSEILYSYSSNKKEFNLL